MGREAVNHLGEGSKPGIVIPERYFYTDFKVLNYLGFKVWYSIHDIVADSARISLLIETVIVSLSNQSTREIVSAMGTDL